MLSLHNVRKYYDKHLALDIPDLRLGNNIYWAKGPNGSGKTTLLRMIAGLLPFEGNIMLNDVSLKDQSTTYRRCISWADAEPLYPPFLTGKELIGFYSHIRHVPAQEANALTASLEMDGYISQKIGSYSSGMTKKLSLVLAFIGSAKVMILDEPLITLDNNALAVISELILDRHDKLHTLFLLSSHVDLDRSLLSSAQQLVVRNNTVEAA